MLTAQYYSTLPSFTLNTLALGCFVNATSTFNGVSSSKQLVSRPAYFHSISQQHKIFALEPLIEGNADDDDHHVHSLTAFLGSDGSTEWQPRDNQTEWHFSARFGFRQRQGGEQLTTEKADSFACCLSRWLVVTTMRIRCVSCLILLLDRHSCRVVYVLPLAKWTNRKWLMFESALVPFLLALVPFVFFALFPAAFNHIHNEHFRRARNRRATYITYLLTQLRLSRIENAHWKWTVVLCGVC